MKNVKLYLPLFFTFLITSIYGQDNNNHIRTYTAREAFASESSLENADKDDQTTSTRYFDGLGRPVQTVVKEGSPDGNDVIQHKTYDQFGRVEKEYLPYAKSDETSGYMRGNPNTEAESFYTTTADKVANDPAPWSTIDYETSPLNRPLEQGAPGTDWQPGEHAIAYQYKTNTIREVIDWQLQSDGTLQVTGTPYYGEETLYKNITEDEEGNRVVEYIDFQERTILKKVQVEDNADDEHHEGWACTYYIYDDFGNLRVVLPPELVRQIATPDVTDYENNGGNILTTDTNSDDLENDEKYYYLPSVTVTLLEDFVALPGFEVSLLPFEVTQDQLNRWAFQYTYDEIQRMATKKVPGADVVYMVYDDRDRLVLTQDGNQRGNNEWSFTKYDVLNRPVMTGIYTDATNTGQSDMQTYVNGQVGQNGLTWYESYTGNTSMHGYDNQSFPQTNEDGTGLNVMTVSYYDNYEFLTTLTEFDNDFEFNDTPPSGYPSAYLETVRNQTTGSKTKNLEDDSFLLTTSYYDNKYRVIQSNSSNQLGGVDRVYNQYDFTGNLTQTRQIHDDGSNTITIEERFEYDHGDRLVNHYHKINSQAEVLLTHNDYNEIGELIDKKLHSTDDGSTYLQSVDHKYNIRGWLTNINSSDLSDLYAGDDDGEKMDYFGMELGYNQNIGISGQQSMYNGNISAMKWNAGSGGNGESERAYQFDYDRLNRIKEANPYHKNATWGAAGDRTKVNNIEYDYNGNIEFLDRYDYESGAMDKMAYDYGADGNRSNQLLSVTDSGDPATGFKDGNTTDDDYAYDDNGNLTQDLNKDITSISYNHMNLPEKIEFGTNNDKYIEYYYDAAGIKLAKNTFNVMTPNRTDYVGNFIYEGAELRIIQHAEGRYVIPQGSSVDEGAYQYYLKDHLGNTRVTFTSEPETETQTATMENENNSYESQYFNYISNREQDGVRNKTVGGDEVLVLDNNYNIGASYKTEVMPGDEVDISVWCAYETVDNTTTNGANTMIDAIAATFGGVPGGAGEAGQIYDGISEAIGGANGMLGGYQGNDEPAAYMNYILFDKDYNFEQGGIWYTIDGNNNEGVNMQQFTFGEDITVKEPGYLFVYLSNESVDDGHKVYFDELNISITKPVIQVEEYYPFGLSIAELSTTRGNIVEQNFKYNGGTELMDDFELNLYETKNRFYSPEVGRFFGIDALSDMMTSMSPMMYSYNNPVNFNDPLGLMGMSGNGDDDEIYDAPAPLPEITITASRIENNTDYSYLLDWRWNRNPLKRATGFEYQRNGLAGVYRQWNTNRTIRRTEGLGYETKFMSGLRIMMGGFSKGVIGSAVVIYGAPILAEVGVVSLSNMGRELLTQEIGNIVTGQDLTNIDVADIGVSGVPGVGYISPIANGFVDINFSHEEIVRIGIYNKTFGEVAYDTGFDYINLGMKVGTNNLDVNKAVVNTFNNFNSTIGFNIPTVISKKALFVNDIED